MEGHIDQLTPIALVTAIALLCGLVLTRLRQPAIVGYILAGVVLGPTGLGIIATTDTVKTLAELGVIMLLFLVGMELSLKSFRDVYKTALLAALLQIAILTGIFGVLGWFLDWPLGRILVFGFASALSSTAVAIKILEETDDLGSPAGKLAVSVLIAQDLAVIPMLLIMEVLQQKTGGFNYAIVIKIVASAGFLGWLTWFLSDRDLLKLPLLDWIKSRRDIVPLAAMASCFGLATITGALGLSAAYGAFIAGLLIGNSNARVIMHQATLPIQAVLLMMFFLSIGLLIDIDFILQHASTVFGILILVTFVKTLINVLVLHALKESWEKSFLAGVVMGQVGEFSFIIIAGGLAMQVISPDGYRLLIAVTALSLVISPLWLIVARRLHHVTLLGVTGLKGILKAAISRLPDVK